LVDKLLVQFHDTNEPEIEKVEEGAELMQANIETACRII